MLFSSLSFLFYSRFGRFFVVLFSSLRFLLYSWFGRFLWCFLAACAFCSTAGLAAFCGAF
jgi:hypothetical protein